MSQCPICRKPTIVEFKPFCSKRCSDVDLGRWLTERYTLPAKSAIEEAEDAE